MSKHRSFAPLSSFPASWPNAISEFISTAAPNFLLRIKPGDATTLEVPAGEGNEQVSIAIDGKFRYITETVERTSPGGSARTLDVYVTTTANVFVPGGGGEVDETVYAFALAIVEHDATPGSVAHYRKVAEAEWDGSAFTALDVLVGAQAGTSRHAATHAPDGTDPVTPDAIGAARAVPKVTELAEVADDGDVVDLVVDAAGAYGGPYVWRMRYRAATSGGYKWHPVGGGPPLRVYKSAAITTPLTNNAVSEGNDTPEIDVPFAGEWEFEMGCTFVSTSGSTAQWTVGLRVGSTNDPGLGLNQASGQSATVWPAGSPPGGYNQVIPAYRSGIRYEINTAGTNVRMRHYVVNAVPGVTNRLILARPVRLGHWLGGP